MKDEYVAIPLDASLLEGELAETDIAALKELGLAAEEETPRMQKLEKAGDPVKGMQSFCFTTDVLEESVRIVVLEQTSSYTSSSVSRAGLFFDWDSALKMTPEENSYSVFSAACGKGTNAVSEDDLLKLESAFEHNVSVEKQEAGYQTTITLYPSPDMEITGVYQMSEDTVDFTVQNPKWHYDAGGRTKYTELTLNEDSENGTCTFEYTFSGLYSGEYFMVKTSDASGKESVYFTRLCLMDCAYAPYTCEAEGVKLESGSSALAGAELMVTKADQNNPPSYVDEDDAAKVLTLAAGGNYSAYSVKLTKNGESVGTLRRALISFPIPEGSDTAKVRVHQKFSSSGGGVTSNGLSATAEETFVRDGRVYAYVDYQDNDFFVFREVETEDITKLAAGGYDVTATLWNASTSSHAQSMAATVVKPEAMLWIEEESEEENSSRRYYLNLTFKEATILYQPAYLNKAYAVKNSVSDEEKNTTAQYDSAALLEFYSEDEVKAFSTQAIKKAWRLLGSADSYLNDNGEIAEDKAEEFDEAVSFYYESEMLQNNLRYVKTICLDITDSIVTEDNIHKGKATIAFCCDIMDTLYNGIPGSDAGFNEAKLMISDAVKNEALTKETVAGAEDTVDKSALKPLYDEAFLQRKNRANYTADSFKSFVQAWSTGYAVYNSNSSTAAEVSNAAAALETALKGIVDISALKTAIADCKKTNPTEANCEANTWAAYYEARSAADALVADASATSQAVADATEALNTAYGGLLASDSYKEAAQTLLTELKELPEENCTEASYKNVPDKITEIESVLSRETVLYKDLYTPYKNLTSVSNGLYASDSYKASALEQAQAAQALDETLYTEESYAKVQTAAETVTNDASKASIKYNSLAAELQNLAAATEELVLKDVDDGPEILEDGTYLVPVALYHSVKDEASMGNSAMVQTGKLVVEDGKGTLFVSFGKMTYAGEEGYLMNLSLLDVTSFLESGYPDVYTANPMTVVSEYDVVDIYNREDSGDVNCAGKKYPKQMKAEIDLTENVFWAQVYVPVMGSMNVGTQTCRLIVDYSKATVYDTPDLTELEQEIKTAEALDTSKYTDETAEALEQALAQAKAVIDNDYCLQSDADSAALTLKNAVAALKEKTVDPADPSDPDDPGEPTEPSDPYKPSEQQPSEQQPSEQQLSEQQPAQSQQTTEQQPAVVKGQTAAVAGNVYRVTADGKNPQAEFVKTTSKESSLTIPATVSINNVSCKVTSVAKNALKSNKTIKTVKIGSNVKSIGANAFAGCKKLTSVTIGKSVTSIGKKAFYGSKNLKKISFSSSQVKTIGAKAFSGTHKSAKVTLPKSMKKKTAFIKKLRKAGLSTKASVK